MQPRPGIATCLIGQFNWREHPDQARQPFALRLDTASYHIQRLPPEPPGVQLDIYDGCALREGTRVVFPLVRLSDAEPLLAIAFDPETLTWGEPILHPQSDE